jgi:hypothetical protein
MNENLQGTPDEGSEYEVVTDRFGPWFFPIEEALAPDFGTRLMRSLFGPSRADVIKNLESDGSRVLILRPASKGPAWLQRIHFQDQGLIITIKETVWEDVPPEIYGSFRMIVESTRNGEDVSRSALPIRAKKPEGKRPDRLFNSPRYEGRYAPLWALVKGTGGNGNGYRIDRSALEIFEPSSATT